MENLTEKESKWNAALEQLKRELEKVESANEKLESENFSLRSLAEPGSEEDVPDSGFRSQQARNGFG